MSPLHLSRIFNVRLKLMSRQTSIVLETHTNHVHRERRKQWSADMISHRSNTSSTKLSVAQRHAVHLCTTPGYLEEWQLQYQNRLIYRKLMTDSGLRVVPQRPVHTMEAESFESLEHRRSLTEVTPDPLRDKALSQLRPSECRRPTSKELNNIELFSMQTMTEDEGTCSDLQVVLLDESQETIEETAAKNVSVALPYVLNKDSLPLARHAKSRISKGIRSNGEKAPSSGIGT